MALSDFIDFSSCPVWDPAFTRQCAAGLESDGVLTLPGFLQDHAIDMLVADSYIAGSLSWLAAKHLDWLAREVDHGNTSPKTLKKRRMMLGKLTQLAGEYTINMPRAEIVHLQDMHRATPAMADAMITSIKVMYDWAIERGFCTENPAAGIKRLARPGGGATPWSMDDIAQFKAYHPPGSMAHLCLTLLAFTACRIGDARLLGRGNEVMRAGVKHLEWQPEKRGASFVSVPIAPQLTDAIASMTLVGKNYILNSHGRHFASADAMSQRFGKWCREAGMENRTAHGIRKAVGNILAEAGCNQYQIMAIHGHSESRTSEIYTRGVERPELARQAIETMKRMEW